MHGVRGISLRIRTSKEPVEKSIKLVQIVREHCTFLKPSFFHENYLDVHTSANLARISRTRTYFMPKILRFFKILAFL